uniref:Carbonic anhydrase n=1 Tax=Aegilops tauschii subsp. strangulata TaxID=200361 RepID=A0A453L7N4_AEGTS
VVTSERSAVCVAVALLCMCFLVTHACDTANGVSFGYSGRTGPKHWGSLSPNFTVCAKGIYQSPINIVRDCVVRDPRMEPLKRYYTSTNATMIDNVFNIALRYNDTVGTVMVDGKTYKLKQLHWHSPSEHTINGKRFVVELHMVHYTDDGNITVVSILYRHGKPDHFLCQIKDKLAELSAEGCKAEKGDPLPVGVIREMTKEQAVALMAPLEKSYRQNSRPIQSLNGRTVQLYDMSHNQNTR